MLPSAPVSLHAIGDGGPVAAVVGETEEGKGERASRISLHLKQSSRNRSASPTSHRYRMTGLPIPNVLPAPSAIWIDPSPSQALKLSPPAPEIRSPRPMPSPKASYHEDIIGSPGQSGRVAVLERMAEEEERRKSQDEEESKLPSLPTSQLRAPSPELSAAELNELLEKALPILPAASTRLNREDTSSKLIADIFKQQAGVVGAIPAIREGELVGGIWASEEPLPKPEPITVLANLPRANHMRDDPAPADDEGDHSGGMPPKKTSKPATALIESPGVGLAALENRLLKEVGTRKPSAAVIQQLRKMDEAITVKRKAEAKRKLTVEPHLKPTGESEVATVAPTEDTEAAIHVVLHRKRRKSYDVEKQSGEEKGKDDPPNEPRRQEDEALRLRKAAKGRVAAWLGDAREADPPPLSETRIIEQASTEDTPAVAQIKKLVEEATSKEETIDPKTTPPTKPRVDPSKIQLPGRTSSGFAPMSRASALLSKPPLRVQDVDAGLKSKPNRALAALSSQKPGNYDVRSARGGRGGKVTSVAAIWAEKTKNTDSDAVRPPKNGLPLPLMVKLGQYKTKLPVPTSPTLPNQGPKSTAASNPSATPPTGLTTHLFKPAISSARSMPVNLVSKGTSVPAKISSSIATPTLSSTASLARSQQTKSPTRSESKSPMKVRPLKVIKEANLPGSVSAPGLAAQPPTPKLNSSVSFGQTRIKDLIARYQQGT